MKFIQIITLMFIGQTSSAQTFEAVPFSAAPFDNFSASSSALADVDGDGDDDVLIAGTIGFEEFTKLYLNDGSGHFTESINTPFEGVRNGSIAYADVDNDNDVDVLITGNNGGQRIAKLYRNDGQGIFSEIADTPFEGGWLGDSAFLDIDGDNDSDLLITGMNHDGDVITKLYKNDGAGNFVEVLNTPFEGVFDSAIAFSDIDGDNDNDILISGSKEEPPVLDILTKLYINDGSGNFSEVLNIPFVDTWRGSSAFSDVDGDGDNDILITGLNTSFNAIAIMYTNDGSGNYSEVINTPFVGVDVGSIAFSDVDGDSDNDLLLTGGDSAGPVAKLYTNDGSGNFSEVMNLPFVGVALSCVAFSDIDGDNDNDVLILGVDESNAASVQLYINTTGTVSTVEKEILNKSGVQIFPNPSEKDNTFLEYNAKKASDIEISIFNNVGRLTEKQFLNAKKGLNTFALNLSSYASGIYFVNVFNGVNSTTLKLVIQRDH